MRFGAIILMVVVATSWELEAPAPTKSADLIVEGLEL
jgi:hypothetical protein